MSDVYLTRAGLQKLSMELDHLKKVKRPKISKAIGEARLQGDISENAEYDAAKEAQGHCEARIAELENVLSSVRIIEYQNIPSDKVYIGAIVTLQNMEAGQEVKYQLVSPEESDFEENKVSLFSPLGKGLMQRREGDEIDIETPDGNTKYKVLKIQRP